MTKAKKLDFQTALDRMAAEIVAAPFATGGVITAHRPLLPKAPILTGISDRLLPLVNQEFIRKTIDREISSTIMALPPPKMDIVDLRHMMKLLNPENARVPPDYRFDDRFGQARRAIEIEIDTTPIDDLNVPHFLDRVLQTIGQTLHECANPDEKADPDAIQARLAHALRLIWWHETIDNMAHDFELPQQRKPTIRELKAETRESPRMSSVLMGLLRRITRDLDYMRDLERQLRGELAEPDDGDAYESHDLWDGVIQTAFDAALSLEANFESRLYGEREEAAA
jgi:hypothetical protein